METKHTPGPWRLYTNATEGLHILAGPVADEELHIVCEQIDSEATARLVIESWAMRDLLAAIARAGNTNTQAVARGPARGVLKDIRALLARIDGQEAK